ncbi:ribonuclease HI family protein [Lentilactobacillus kosonis]|uniref:Ribonuclease HI, Bacillus nonfunctional homolog n=1 Tax=Lentilactobacillus kosonis TaxID=2810561 RepID=A0A401FKU3_9LACO|nr:ribonuclease HI family protein [Lentilactobacillus kosonis]GAY72992.1 ribonuclease HI, Bacillus nonfunctional homolog [Lentilactobacillus kosonis]
MIKLYTDAAVNQKYQKSAAGILILQNSDQIQLTKPLTTTDNHEAEFQAALIGHQQIKPVNSEELIFFYTDSKIVAEAINKQYAKHYQLYVDQLLELEAKLGTVITEWIPDRENKGAHNLALQALHHLERI